MTEVLLLLLLSRSSSLLRARWMCKLLHIQQALSALEERLKSNNNTDPDFLAWTGDIDEIKKQLSNSCLNAKHVVTSSRQTAVSQQRLFRHQQLPPSN